MYQGQQKSHPKALESRDDSLAAIDPKHPPREYDLGYIKKWKYWDPKKNTYEFIPIGPLLYYTGLSQEELGNVFPKLYPAQNNPQQQDEVAPIPNIPPSLNQQQAQPQDYMQQQQQQQAPREHKSRDGSLAALDPAHPPKKTSYNYGASNTWEYWNPKKNTYEVGSGTPLFHYEGIDKPELVKAFPKLYPLEDQLTVMDFADEEKEHERLQQLKQMHEYSIEEHHKLKKQQHLQQQQSTLTRQQKYDLQVAAQAAQQLQNLNQRHQEQEELGHIPNIPSFLRQQQRQQQPKQAAPAPIQQQVQLPQQQQVQYAQAPPGIPQQMYNQYQQQLAHQMQQQHNFPQMGGENLMIPLAMQELAMQLQQQPVVHIPHRRRRSIDRAVLGNFNPEFLDPNEYHEDEEED